MTAQAVKQLAKQGTTPAGLAGLLVWLLVTVNGQGEQLALIRADLATIKARINLVTAPHPALDQAAVEFLPYPLEKGKQGRYSTTHGTEPDANPRHAEARRGPLCLVAPYDGEVSRRHDEPHPRGGTAGGFVADYHELPTLGETDGSVSPW
jgi:hypothetical protein